MHGILLTYIWKFPRKRLKLTSSKLHATTKGPNEIIHLHGHGVGGALETFPLRQPPVSWEASCLHGLGFFGTVWFSIFWGSKRLPPNAREPSISYAFSSADMKDMSWLLAPKFLSKTCNTANFQDLFSAGSLSVKHGKKPLKTGKGKGLTFFQILNPN